MTISKIDLKPSTLGSTAAYGSVTFDDMLSINVKVQKGGSNGVFVSWPQYQDKEKAWKNYLFFTDRDVKDGFDNEIMKSFNDTIGLGAPQETSKPEAKVETKTDKPKRKVTFS